MKNNWMWIVIVLLVVGVFGYTQRHQLKMILGGPKSPEMTKEMTKPSTSPSGDMVMTKSNASKGNYLVGANGMTLYVFDKDQPGVSNCNGGCATLWPPYAVGASAPATLPANLTTIKRADGSMQYAYNARPLYFYQPDQKVGDVLGDGVNGTWHLVKP